MSGQLAFLTKLPAYDRELFNCKHIETVTNLYEENCLRQMSVLSFSFKESFIGHMNATVRLIARRFYRQSSSFDSCMVF
jgi:hypothetical protein